MTLPQQSNRQDIANREKKYVASWSYRSKQIKTAPSFGICRICFKFRRHQLRGTVGLHWLLENTSTLKDLLDPSRVHRTRFFFSVSLVLMNTTNFYRPTLLRRRALQQIASFWRLEKFFFSLFLKNQMSDAFLKEGSEAEVSTANEPHQLKFIKVTPWSWFKMRRTMSWATHWEKRQTSEIGQDIFCVLILVYFVEWLLNVILILRVNSVIYSIVESLWNDISLSLLHAWMTAICLSLV